MPAGRWTFESPACRVLVQATATCRRYQRARWGLLIGFKPYGRRIKSWTALLRHIDRLPVVRKVGPVLFHGIPLELTTPEAATDQHDTVPELDIMLCPKFASFAAQFEYLIEEQTPHACAKSAYAFLKALRRPSSIELLIFQSQAFQLRNGSHRT